jgi:hypothetical protein
MILCPLPAGHLPDYACLLVGANMGVVGMCKEHLGVALALKVPVFFVITKVDIAPEQVLKNTVQNLASILKKPGVRKKPYLVRGRDEVITAARNITTDSLAPIFLTSAVTGGYAHTALVSGRFCAGFSKWTGKAPNCTALLVAVAPTQEAHMCNCALAAAGPVSASTQR